MSENMVDNYIKYKQLQIICKHDFSPSTCIDEHHYKITNLYWITYMPLEVVHRLNQINVVVVLRG